MSAFEAVTFTYIPQMISLADFQPLSIAKFNIFLATIEVLHTDISLKLM